MTEPSSLLSRHDAILQHAAALLRQEAEIWRACHTAPTDYSDWGDDTELKAEYDEFIKTADALEALVA